MRRPAPTMPLSPKMLRHFAVVTVGLTVVIALFADEARNGPVEEAFAKREAQNQMMAKDAEKFGQHQLRIAPGALDTAGEFAGDEAMPLPDPPASGVRNSLQPGPSAQANAMPLPPPNLPMTPGASVTVRNVSGDYLPTAQGTTAKKTTPFRPDAKQIEAIHQTSRERSGSAQGND